MKREFFDVSPVESPLTDILGCFDMNSPGLSLASLPSQDHNILLPDSFPKSVGTDSDYDPITFFNQWKVAIAPECTEEQQHIVKLLFESHGDPAVLKHELEELTEKEVGMSKTVNKGLVKNSSYFQRTVYEHKLSNNSNIIFPVIPKTTNRCMVSQSSVPDLRSRRLPEETKFGDIRKSDSMYSIDNKSYEKKYRCKLCVFSTHWKGSLKRHQLVHKKAEEKQFYKCQYCDYKTLYKDNLKTLCRIHLTNTHQGKQNTNTVPPPIPFWKTAHSFTQSSASAPGQSKCWKFHLHQPPTYDSL